MSPIFGFDNFFYNGMLKKYVGIFGSIFSDIYIQRTSDDKSRTDVIKVPIKYGNGNMYIKAEQGELRETSKVSRILPAMAFEIDNLYKDVSRKTNANNIIQQIEYKTENGVSTRPYQFNRVPYNIIFTLKIHTKNIDDMLQIVEQIVPAFDGNLCITLEDTQNNVNNNQEIIIRINEIKIVDNFEDEMKSRLVEYSISFEMKAFLYKQTITGYVIKEIDIYAIAGIDESIAGLTPDIIVNDQFPLTDKQNLLPTISDLESQLFASVGNIDEVTNNKIKVRKTRKG